MDTDHNTPFSELKSDFTKLFLDHNLDFFAKRNFYRILDFLKNSSLAADLGLLEIPKISEDSIPFNHIEKPVNSSRKF
jgi:gluconate kinase